MVRHSASERFDKLASNFANSEVHASSPTIQRLHALLGVLSDITVCDVACGAGHLALSFERASRIVGVDPSPNMLAAFRDLASKRGIQVETVMAHAESIPLPTGEFDVTVSRLAPHHFADVERAIREMVRLTKPGGVVSVIDLEGSPDPAIDEFNHSLEILHDPTHVRSYTASRWGKIFKGADLIIENMENELSERPGGVSVSRWCEIASSGAEAETAIRRLLNEAPSQFLNALGITRSANEFLMPIRTVLLIGRKP